MFAGYSCGDGSRVNGTRCDGIAQCADRVMNSDVYVEENCCLQN